VLEASEVVEVRPFAIVTTGPCGSRAHLVGDRIGDGDVASAKRPISPTTACSPCSFAHEQALRVTVRVRHDGVAQIGDTARRPRFTAADGCTKRRRGGQHDVDLLNA
jgi:hypothetical protein